MKKIDLENLQKRAYELETENKLLLEYNELMRRRIAEALYHIERKNEGIQSLVLTRAVMALRGESDDKV